MDTDLAVRSWRDFSAEPLASARTAEARLVACVTRAYPEQVQRAAAALRRGQSVLVEVPPVAAPSWIAALCEPSGRTEIDDFEFFSLEDTRVGYGFEADNPVIEDPTHRLLHDGLQRFLWSGEARVVGVLDMLDAVLTGGGRQLTDLLLLLTARRFADRVLVGMVTPGVPVPVALRRRFALHLRFPPIDRRRLWALLTYEEVQTILGARELTVPIQVRLHQLLGRLDVWQLRTMLEQLAHTGQPIQSPAQALAELHTALAPDRAESSWGATAPIAARETLTQCLVMPWNQLRDATEADQVQALERSWPLAALLIGSAAAGHETARWLAAACDATLITTAGWGLTEVATRLHEGAVLPTVVYAQDLETADDTAQRAWLELRASFRPEDPLWLVAQTADPSACPAGLRAHCHLHLNLEEG